MAAAVVFLGQPPHARIARHIKHADERTPRLAAFTLSIATLNLHVRSRLASFEIALKTLDLFAEAETSKADAGVALQAYLTRTYDDIASLRHRRSRVRICKGIDAEESVHLVDGASTDRSAINGHFVRHVSSALQAGSFVGMATHDEALIDSLITLIRREQIEPDRFEFQMLPGVCEPLRERLRSMGFPVRVYVPYGRDWYGDSTRRIRENPRIAGYVIRARCVACSAVADIARTALWDASLSRAASFPLREPQRTFNVLKSECQPCANPLR
ncbi:proline dehydrogenase family protein [Paraburkholderia caballeronis]|uniref:proline dehydrogenase family protein n=1 Tax=Paraburkholderia caballeronis TaxID=416943 RepID=UPI001066A8FF|nr:proline dehydrogenase family protein [Paraburkholderia caballeronis]TDV09227.1 L-proline dehydrogenase [Paraburkholderia caballeronis]TDV12287.1 L-proline dehydrogenase [Paraburkholderia caballeronis]TDV22760.1 L-proline dehydrogenase [Paraburkholderia caballeronis]